MSKKKKKASKKRASKKASKKIRKAPSAAQKRNQANAARAFALAKSEGITLKQAWAKIRGGGKASTKKTSKKKASKRPKKASKKKASKKRPKKKRVVTGDGLTQADHVKKYSSKKKRRAPSASSWIPEV